MSQPPIDPESSAEIPTTPYHRPHDPVVLVPGAVNLDSDDRRASEFGDQRGNSQRKQLLPVEVRRGGPHDITNVEGSEKPEVTLIRKPSLRRRRRQFTVACTAFTIGALLVIGSSPLSREFFVPGPLSAHHAPLIASEGGDRCAACHANANGSLTDWISSVFVSDENHGLTQAELCMKCHENSLAADFALNPHNVSAEKLTQISARINGGREALGITRSVMGTVTQISTRIGGEREGQTPSRSHHGMNIACCTCHQEHHGGTGLTTLTDAQCQTCHGQTFHSFENGHPEFTNWPQTRRTRIAFDHASHSAKHFPEKQKAFQCSTCHVDDDYQNVKKLASFEQTCAQCHNQQILDSGSEGLVLISLPMLDMQAIEEAGLDPGNWPAMATGDFDGSLPPMMRLMLVADPQAREIFTRRSPDFDFGDFDPEFESDVADAVELVWAIKRLLKELAEDGPHAVRERLESVLEFDISDDELRQIITNLDQHVFHNAVKRWLPDLGTEMPDKSKGDANARMNGQGRGPLSDLQLAPKSIAWRPETVELLANRAADDSAPELLAINPLKQLLATGQPTRQAPPATPKDSVLPVETDDQVPNGQDILSAVSPHTSHVSENDAPNTTRPASDLRPPPSIDRNPLIVPTGWFRNDDNFSIRYLPTGHADRCLQSWIELVTRISNANTRPETQSLFEKTISASGIGLCRTCHTVDQLPDHSFLVNWTARYRDPSIRSFTRFTHGPHLLQPELQDCSHCHQLDPAATNAHSFLDTSPNNLVSNFLPTTKSDCIQCHQKNRSGSHCTQCHNYHIGSHVID